MFRARKLRPDRKNKLDSLGMEWNTPPVKLDEARWDTMFRKLQEYNGHHGNCYAPFNYAPDPQLGRWVNNQRQNARNGIMKIDLATGKTVSERRQLLLQ